MLALAGPARADQWDTNPNHQWYGEQHNSLGEWCCDWSDAERYDGDYSIQRDGSVTLNLAAGDLHIDAGRVLRGPNPTGAPVWWHTPDKTWCFAPGQLG